MQQSLMQTVEWAEFKSRYGWDHRNLMGFLALRHELFLKFDFCYIPEITIETGESLVSMAAKAQSALSHTKTVRTIFGRAEFLVPYSEAHHRTLLQAGYTKPRDEIQPEHRQIIDITASLSEIRTAMKQKGRYNTNLAERKGVIVAEDHSAEGIAAFCQINRATSVRKGYAGRSESYITDLIHTLHQHKTGGLWLARYDGQVLAGAIVSFYGTRASYLYGASSDEQRQVMAPYLLHYRVIEEAKRRGCTVYDLIGVAPEDAPHTHPWAGISRFKREFGGETVRYLGSYDRVYRPFLYSLYRLARRK